MPTSQAEGDYGTHPPAGAPPVDLGRDLALTEFDQDEADLIMNACMPRGHCQYMCLHAFVRTLDAAVAARPDSYSCDVDNTVFTAMLLSRLVRDNGYSLEFAARVVDHADGVQQVIPVYAAEFVASYRLRNDRDWLTGAEAGELRRLLDAWWAVEGAMPERVVRALNLAEDVVHEVATPTPQTTTVSLFIRPTELASEQIDPIHQCDKNLNGSVGHRSCFGHTSL